jgi:DNA-binding CsgD family transcriptional regulator
MVVSMDEYLTKSDIESFLSLTEDLLVSNSLYQFVERFLTKTKIVFNCEYLGIILVPRALTPQRTQPSVCTSNLFKKAYENYLCGQSIKLEALIKQKNLIHWFIQDGSDYDGAVLRSTRNPKNYGKEILCLMIHNQNTFIGYFGLVRSIEPSLKYPNLEGFLQLLLKKILEKGITYHIQREIEALLVKEESKSNQGFALLLFPNNTVEYVKGGDTELAKAFIAGTLLEDSFDRHPAILSIRKHLEQTEHPLCTTGDRNFLVTFGRFSLFVTVLSQDQAYLPVALIRITNGDTIFPFDMFAHQHKLTDREKQILHKIAEGLTNDSISNQLGISEHTVKRHVYNIFEKVGCCSRAQLICLLSGCRDHD